MIIAHRGASGTAPENTLAAFRMAIDLDADWLELDVCASRDGEVVVIHDDTLERTTDGKGRACDFTLAQLKHLDAGRWFHRRFTGEQIPTLREVLSLAKARGVGLLIEMKTGSHLGHGFEEKVTSLLAGAGLLHRSFVMSFNHAAVLRAKGAEPKLRTLLLIGKRVRLNRLADAVHAHRAEGISVKESLASKKLVETMRANGLIVVVWTVNPVGAMKRFLARDVDGITTNYPERLVKLLSKAANKGKTASS